MKETTKNLFALIYNRLSENGELFPRYIGEFDGIDSLPREAFPPIYSWLDRTGSESVILSFNIPLLERMCVMEAEMMDLPIDDGAIAEAISLLKDVSSQAFEKTLLRQG